MDILSHATVGAGVALLITGTSDPSIATQGALIGMLPDILGVPVTEGYHMVKANFHIFGKKNFTQAFHPGTMNRWEKLPRWIYNYYQFLHSIWFVILTAGILFLVSPALIYLSLVLLISHILPDILLHKDDPKSIFKHGIRPFWPLKWSFQKYQWTDFKWWGEFPLIPIVIQIIFWTWYLTL